MALVEEMLLVGCLALWCPLGGWAAFASIWFPNDLYCGIEDIREGFGILIDLGCI
jgi:hypothetical protein